MKVYTYKLEDTGCASESGLRLPGMEATQNPAEADVFLVPAPMFLMNPNGDESKLLSLPHIKQYDPTGRRHVLLDISDYDPEHPSLPDLMTIRGNCKGWHKRKYKNTIAWPWPVESLPQCIEPPKDGFTHSVGFYGWRTSSNVRESSLASAQKVLGEKASITTFTEFYGYIERDNPELAKVRRAAFLDNVRSCLLQMTPCSIHGVFPYRFYEAMSAARVPILFCSDYTLPWQNHIDWDACTIRFDAVEDPPKAGELIQGVLDKYTPAQLIEMGKRGRAYWEKYLNRDKFSELFTLAVTENLNG